MRALGPGQTGGVVRMRVQACEPGSLVGRTLYIVLSSMCRARVKVIPRTHMHVSRTLFLALDIWDQAAPKENECAGPAPIPFGLATRPPIGVRILWVSWVWVHPVCFKGSFDLILIDPRGRYPPGIPSQTHIPSCILACMATLAARYRTVATRRVP